MASNEQKALRGDAESYYLVNIRFKSARLIDCQLHAEYLF
jgi:hypothetical protein